MAWYHGNPNLAPAGIRTRGGVGNQQSQSRSSYPPAVGGPVVSTSGDAPAPTPPSLRTSIGMGPIVVNPGPISAVIPRQKHRGAIAWQFAYVVSSNNNLKPVQMPGFRLPAGGTVRVRASNIAGGNAHPIVVGNDPAVIATLFLGNASASGSYSGSAGTVLQSLDDVEFNVHTTAEIWVIGFYQDGVVLSVNMPFGLNLKQ
jgi:hypothetical protein